MDIIITVFLAVLILALILGNILLFFVPKKRLFSSETGQQETAIVPEIQQLPVQTPNSAVQGMVLEERLNLINKRLSYAESQILKLKNSENGNNDSLMARKLFALEEFKRNSHIEIEALKERLAETRKELNLSEKKKETVPEISDRELHSLVFNAGKKSTN